MRGCYVEAIEVVEGWFWWCGWFTRVEVAGCSYDFVGRVLGISARVMMSLMG